MTSLVIRRVRFDLDGDIPFIWNPRNPTFSVFANAVSVIAVVFEKLIVAATREAMPLITDSEAKSEAEAFLRQEAQHANAHRQHVRALARRYPGLEDTLAQATRCFDGLTETAPLDFRLAYTANLEATFTPFFKLLLDLGIFARHGALAGAVCVGFVHSCFYEVFDHIGPQLKWWMWNTDNSSTAPALGSVPLTSIALFSALAPIVVALLVQRWVAQPVAEGAHLGLGALTARAVAVGALATVALGVLGAPAWLLRGNPLAQAMVYWLAVAAVVIIGGFTVARAWPAARRQRMVYDNTYAKVFGTAFLLAMAISWGSGLPEYLVAVDGVTASGTATGVLPYAAVCFVIAALLVIAMFGLPTTTVTPGDRRDGLLNVRTV